MTVDCALGFVACGDDVVEEAGDGERTDAARYRGDGGEVVAGADIICDVAL